MHALPDCNNSCYLTTCGCWYWNGAAVGLCIGGVRGIRRRVECYKGSGWTASTGSGHTSGLGLREEVTTDSCLPVYHGAYAYVQ